MSLTIDYATPSDIRAFYGRAPTMKAVCVKRGEVPVAIVGVALEGIQAKLFSEHRDLSETELRFTWWRAAQKAMQFVRESRRPVVAVAEHEQGRKNIERLGFVHVKENYYQWPF